MHDMKDAPDDLSCILHNGCEELRFIHQRSATAAGRSCFPNSSVDSDIIPVMNNSFRFAMRSDIYASAWPYEVIIGAGTAVPLRVQCLIQIIVIGK